MVLMPPSRMGIIRQRRRRVNRPQAREFGGFLLVIRRARSETYFTAEEFDVRLPGYASTYPKTLRIHV